MFLKLPTSVKTAFALFAAAASAFAASPVREPTPFVTVSNTGLGRSLYVVGGHPDLGAWSPTASVRLAWSPGNVWSGQVAVQAGTTAEYKFISRVDSSGQHCQPTNVEWMGGANLTNQIPAQPAAPYAGKAMYYHSSWTSAFVRWSVNGSNFFDTAFDRMGDGRFGGESLFRASGFAEEGNPVQFVCSGYLNGTQYWDNAPYGGFGSGDYYTPLDVFFLQDGDLFNYVPPPAPSAPTIVTQFVASSYSNIPGRTVRVYLPRGYTNNTWKRYPVLYMHDGQNIFDPLSGFPSWGVHHTSTREISQGRMRESIVVAVNNSGFRCAELLPPGDTIQTSSGACYTTNPIPGLGDQYADFMIHNVRPYVDTTFRARNDVSNTFVAGSSLGGLISSWMALRTNVFGGAGVLSPAFWAAGNFVGWIATNSTKGSRLYLDAGTSESDDSMWDPFWIVRGLFLQDGYAENGDLLTRIGCGAGHNEAAWSNRLHHLVRFLLPPEDEPNRLAQAEYPPRIEWGGGVTSLVHRSLGGFAYRLEIATNGSADVWLPIATSAVEALPWSSVAWTFTNTPPGGAKGLFRAAVVQP